jgi:hypothetical protein
VEAEEDRERAVAAAEDAERVMQTILLTSGEQQDVTESSANNDTDGNTTATPNN